MKNNDFSMFAQKIALWGPPNSGKSLLIRAFENFVISKSEEFDKDFSYKLSVTFPSRSEIISELPIVSHGETVHREWKFKRVSKLDPHLPKEHIVSMHSHHLLVQDVLGDFAFELNDEAKTAFKDANLVLVLLDHTALGSSGEKLPDLNIASKKLKPKEEDGIDLDALFEDTQDLSENNIQAPDLENVGQKNYIKTKEQYREAVKKLLIYLDQERLENRFVVFCVTKMDQTAIKPSSSENLISTLFGLEMVNLIKQYQTRLHVRMTGVSSIGFVNEKGRTTQVSNYNQTAGTIKFPREWHPYNVTLPFFPYFQSVEINKLKQNSGFFDRLFMNDNLTAYKKYKLPDGQEIR